MAFFSIFRANITKKNQSDFDKYRLEFGQNRDEIEKCLIFGRKCPCGTFRVLLAVAILGMLRNGLLWAFRP